MILSDKHILQEIEKGTIKLVPYDRECLGSNSYDVHLGKWLATYNEHILDAKKHNQIDYFEIFSTWALLKNIQKRMPMCLSWKANPLQAALGSTFMPQPVKGM
jgi:deoxycytidine triphosphate deaminase